MAVVFYSASDASSYQVFQNGSGYLSGADFTYTIEGLTQQNAWYDTALRQPIHYSLKMIEAALGGRVTPEAMQTAAYKFSWLAGSKYGYDAALTYWNRGFAISMFPRMPQAATYHPYSRYDEYDVMFLTVMEFVAEEL